jgi:hypothetical protein
MYVSGTHIPLQQIVILEVVPSGADKSKIIAGEWAARALLTDGDARALL